MFIFIVNFLYLYSLNKPPHFFSSILIFSIGIVIILMNVIGAGDIKLLAVLAMTFPVNELPDFIFLVTVSGLPLILIVFLLHNCCRGRFSKTLPYGVAISSGYLLKLFI